MNAKFVFDPDLLASMAGGRSALDIRFLNIHTLEQAEAFISGYGYDLNQNADSEKLWYYHRRAVVLLTEKLGFDIETIPEVLRERKNLEDLRRLLIYASSRSAEEQDFQRWSCAVLRAMHVFVHAENDLFSFFAEEIQKQILTPFESSVSFSGEEHRPVLNSKVSNLPAIELMEYTHKAFKTSTSTVVKLLAKPDALALSIFDKVGVRFVTKSIFDSFQVLRFLWRENLVSFPHIMPDQSSNNLYPTSLFVNVCNEIVQKGLDKDLDDKKIESLLLLNLEKFKEDHLLLRKENLFSAEDYRFVKFISRKLIKIPPQDGKEGFSFFYPFEVQILDHNSFEIIQSGPSEHQAYKDRQKQAAKERLFPQQN
ncbi:MAG: TIGR04552 family protein [Bdellovibrionia bacterium]